MKQANFLTVLFIFYYCPQAMAYSLIKNKYGDNIRWPSRQLIHFNPTNQSYISEEDANTIFLESLGEWTRSGRFDITMKNTSEEPQKYRNDALFSSNPLFFGGMGVLAVTNITFRQNTAEIIEANILLRDGYLSTNRANNNHLGNIITHELGHFIALGHSPILNATMFYQARRGQYQLAGDDRSGLQELYGVIGEKGIISGTVIGGRDLTGIFGTHIKAISMKTGKVSAGTFSEPDGRFSIVGLDINDTYYLYTGPPQALSTLPDYYSTARTDFCTDRTPYRGSFFQTCNNSESGFPQGIALTSRTPYVNVGNITIRCGFDVPSDYMQAKGSSYTLPITDGSSNRGNAYSGYFSSTEVNNNTADEITIDLSDRAIPSNDYYLDIKVIYQSLYSKVKIDMNVTNDQTLASEDFGLTTDSYGNPVLDIDAQISLNQDSSNNVFTVTLTPNDFSTFLSNSVDYGQEELFYPDFSNFGDDMVIYFVIASVRQLASGEYQPRNFRAYSLGDNQTCFDANLAYPVKGNTVVRRPIQSSSDEPGSFGCGTIEYPSSGPPNGPMGLILGIFLTLFLWPRYARIV